MSPHPAQTMEVLIRPIDRTLHVPPGTNLLDALRENRVPMSYSCTAGRCGTCRCRILEGEVISGGPDTARADDGDERSVLACQTWLSGPCTIEIPEPDEVVVHPARVLKAKLLSIEAPCHDVRRLRLGIAKPLEFSPGQYANLQFSGGPVRPYSMANLPGEGELEFHVRIVPQGRVTRHIAEDLAPGDAIRVSGPLGSAYLRLRDERPILCVAGGTGLAPVLSILRGAAAAGLRNPIRVYVGARRAEDLYGLDWIEALRPRLPSLSIQCVVGADDGTGRFRTGLVTDAIESDLPELSGWRTYLCGSPPMVEAATRLVRARGADPGRIHADAFYPSGT